MNEIDLLPTKGHPLVESILLKILEKRSIHVCPSCLHEIDPEWTLTTGMTGTPLSQWAALVDTTKRTRCVVGLKD
jgi:hypothetical protein